VRQTIGWELYYYGNVQGQGEGRGWYTFDHRPRFNNNYLGLRNRIGLLSEAYSYATFEDRMTATRHFVHETLSFAWANATEIRTLLASVDAVSIVGERLALRATFARSAEPVEILLGGVVEEGHPFSGETILRRTDERRPERMFEFGTFTGVETEVVPRAYLVPSQLTAVLRNLEAHGIEMTPLPAGPTSAVERYRISSLDTAENPFEGRREQTLTGSWEAAGGPLPDGLIEVSMDQPLARLIFSLLEPRSDDGLANWGLMSPSLAGASSYPILRLP
jgi:hypothetical protein